MKNRERIDLNRLLAEVLLCGILLTLMTDGLIGAARQRRSLAKGQPTSGRETAEAGEITRTQYDSNRDSAVPAQLSEEMHGALPAAQGAAGNGEISGSGAAHPSGAISRYDEFLKKFHDTETALSSLRQTGTGDRTGVERRNTASAQLRYWETQLNSLYQAVMGVLPDEEAAVLARDQQDWRKLREETAAAAVRDAAGSPKESTEYTLSQVESTRKRAYELLERYRDRLE